MDPDHWMLSFHGSCRTHKCASTYCRCLCRGKGRPSERSLRRKPPNIFRSKLKVPKELVGKAYETPSGGVTTCLQVAAAPQMTA